MRHAEGKGDRGKGSRTGRGGDRVGNSEEDVSTQENSPFRNQRQTEEECEAVCGRARTYHMEVVGGSLLGGG